MNLLLWSLMGKEEVAQTGVAVFVTSKATLRELLQVNTALPVETRR